MFIKYNAAPFCTKFMHKNRSFPLRKRPQQLSGGNIFSPAVQLVVNSMQAGSSTSQGKITGGKRYNKITQNEIQNQYLRQKRHSCLASRPDAGDIGGPCRYRHLLIKKASTQPKNITHVLTNYGAYLVHVFVCFTPSGFD